MKKEQKREGVPVCLHPEFAAALGMISRTTWGLIQRKLESSETKMALVAVGWEWSISSANAINVPMELSIDQYEEDT